MNINSKVYYDIATGEVLAITSESEGGVVSSTKEEDMATYEPLHNKSVSDIDSIELEYGALVSTFTGAKSYHVDISAKKLKVEYHTIEELQAIENQEQESQTLNNRISDISSYLMEQKESITDIEDYILQTELNKIMEGMI